MDDISAQIKARLAQTMDQDNFKTWIEPISSMTYGDGIVMLRVPNGFFRDWIVQNFEVLIRDSIFQTTKTDARIEYVVEKQDPRPAPKNTTV